MKYKELGEGLDMQYIRMDVNDAVENGTLDENEIIEILMGFIGHDNVRNIIHYHNMLQPYHGGFDDDEPRYIDIITALADGALDPLNFINVMLHSMTISEITTALNKANVKIEKKEHLTYVGVNRKMNGQVRKGNKLNNREKEHVIYN